MAQTKFTNFKIAVKLPFLDLEGNWEIDLTQRQAAWEIYVELATRITTAPLQADEGLLREALSSYYSLFGTTREILKKYGPAIATPAQSSDTTLGHIAVGVLNRVLRPVLAKWHPLLQAHESLRLNNAAPADHERAWPEAVALRAEIDQVRIKLSKYADVLAEVAGVSALH